MSIDNREGAHTELKRETQVCVVNEVYLGVEIVARSDSISLPRFLGPVCVEIVTTLIRTQLIFFVCIFLYTAVLFRIRSIYNWFL